MSKVVLKIAHLSNLYQLGEFGTGTLSRDLNLWWHLIRGKPNPYTKIGESNIQAKKGNSDFIWALKNINLEVKEGEILAIIGNNGAGKSTLLKILSKITTPTEGRFRARGRIASLLEVGTGFHPELTGKENIFLNGAILGMTKKEVSKKLDSIIEFAGITRYINTPVKRYSSGMMVRLGFAVAAHLEPEILIVDEVLAVGDADFQKRCLNKMNEISSNSGRTILFVSHDLQAIKKLCNRALLLKQGMTNGLGPVQKMINQYLKFKPEKENKLLKFEIPEEKQLEAYIKEISFCNVNGQLFYRAIPIGNQWKVKIKIVVQTELHEFRVGIGFAHPSGIPLRTSWSFPIKIKKGNYCFTFWENRLSLNEGEYPVYLSLSTQKTNIQYLDNLINLNISSETKSNELLEPNRILSYKSGFILNQLEYSFKKID